DECGCHPPSRWTILAEPNRYRGKRLEPNSAAGQILFTPMRIGGVELKNRFVFQPHYTALGSFDGMPTERLAAYHEERARGGAALIVVESQAVHPTGKMAGRFIHAWDSAVVPGYRKLTQRVHAHAAKIFGQL